MTTQKQKEARERNWEILKLRGMYHSLNVRNPHRLIWSETGENFAIARQAIDNVIALMGAEPEALRKIKREEEMKLYLKELDEQKDRKKRLENASEN